MAEKFKCPMCHEDVEGKAAYASHVTNHVLKDIRESYPEAIKAMETIESEHPVTFLMKVDVEKAIQAHSISETILEGVEEEEA